MGNRPCSDQSQPARRCDQLNLLQGVGPPETFSFRAACDGLDELLSQSFCFHKHECNRHQFKRETCDKKTKSENSHVDKNLATPQLPLNLLYNLPVITVVVDENHLKVKERKKGSHDVHIAKEGEFDSMHDLDLIISALFCLFCSQPLQPDEQEIS